MRYFDRGKECSGGRHTRTCRSSPSNTYTTAASHCDTECTTTALPPKDIEKVYFDPALPHTLDNCPCMKDWTLDGYEHLPCTQYCCNPDNYPGPTESWCFVNQSSGCKHTWGFCTHDTMPQQGEISATTSVDPHHGEATFSVLAGIDQYVASVHVWIGLYDEMYGDIIWTNVEPGQVYATTADAYYDGLVGEVVQAVGDTAAQSTFVFAEYDYWDGGMSALIPIVYYPHVVIAGHNQNTTGYLYCTVTDESTSWTMYVKTHDETFLQQVPRNGGKFRLMRHYEKDGVRTNETSSQLFLWGERHRGSESGPLA